MANTFIHEILDTWDDGGTDFQAFELHITDTASAATSSPIRVLVDAVKKFDLRKDGYLHSNSVKAGPSGSLAEIGLFSAALGESGNRLAAFTTGFGSTVGGVGLASDKVVEWDSTTNFGAAGSDAGIARVGAASLKVTDGSAGLGALTALRHLVTGGTVTADAPILDATQTWNNGAVTFNGIKANITNTASAAGSSFIRLQLDASEKFRIGKEGGIVQALSANTAALATTGYSLTGSDATSLVDLAGTWNTTGTPTLLKANVTDTASNAASLLLDLQVGGVSKFKIDKAGLVVTGSSLRIGGASENYITGVSGNTFDFYRGNGVHIGRLSQDDLSLSASSFGMGSAASPDVGLGRVANASLKVTDGSTGFGNLTLKNLIASSDSVTKVDLETAGQVRLVPNTGGEIRFYNGATLNLRSDASKIYPFSIKFDLGASANRFANAYLGGQTITADAPALDITQTWNNGAVIFNGIKANFTDTASNAASLLMDLQVGGASQFSVAKNGNGVVNGNVRIGGPSANYIVGTGTSTMDFHRGSNGVHIGRLSQDGFALSAQSLGFNNAASPDSGVARVAAASLKVTDGTTGLGALTALRHTVTGGTVTADTPLLNLTQTWNNGAVTFNGIKANITDTASNAASLLLDLQVGGTSQATVKKNGRGGFLLYESPDQGDFLFYRSNNLAMRSGTSITTFNNALGLSATNGASNPDWRIEREGADDVTIRRGTNSQKFSIAKTWTDASNYERLSVNASSLQIAAESAGTGSANLDVTITPKGTGRVRFGTHSAIGAETVTGFIEIKDSAGTVRKVAVVS